MSTDRLHQFSRLARARIEEMPPTTLLETRSIVDDLLRALGWDVYDHCQTNVSLQGTTLEYVCTIDSVPALFVAVEAASSDLVDDRVDELIPLLGATGVDRAIYTNGRTTLLLAGTASVDIHRCDLWKPNTLEPLADHYTRRALSERLQRHSRPVVARKLALEREAVRAAMVDLLADVTGEAYTRELEGASDRFLDSLIAAFAWETTASPSTAAQSSPAESPFQPATAWTDAETGEPTQKTGEPARDDTSNAVHYTDRTIEEEEAPVEMGGTATRGDDEPSDAGRDEDGDYNGDGDHDKDGEYVVRFFSDQGSIGAIGHSTSTGALVHATEFLLERGLSGVRLPWPEVESESESASHVPAANGDPVLVSRDEAYRLSQGQQLSNGIHLNTAGTVEEHVERIEALGCRAGYRVMLTGDWEDQ
ncbi:hypothetical protein [Natronosalvus vescus]|uniref:hypothetical protein n=1 Tax=Natronosalvus vescus TaxID=2953881 RepID=UPI00209032B0|nr:hypothetical protein [Natronosalvus vescus]